MSPGTHTGTIEALRPGIVRVVRHEGARVIYTGFQARGALPRQAVARGLRHSRRSPARAAAPGGALVPGQRDAASPRAYIRRHIHVFLQCP